MSASDQLDLLLAGAGGLVDWAALPRTFPIGEARSLEKKLNRLAKHFASSLGVNKILVFFTNATGISARLHQYRDKRYVITIPIGIFARLYAFHRRLWSYNNREKKGINPKALLQFASSPADDVDPDSFVVPEFVRCIMSEYSSDQEFWRDITAFDAANEHKIEIDFNVSILTTQAISLINLHELGHLALGHFALSTALVGDAFAAEKALLRKGMELESDYFAGSHLAWVVTNTVASFKAPADKDYWARSFFRLAFSLFVCFATFDPRRRSLSRYDGRVYPHPIVRHQAARQGIAEFLTQDGKIVDFWRKFGIVGWLEAEQCLSLFTVMECMNDASPNSLIPIHGLLYGGKASEPYVSAKLQHGQGLFEATRAIRERFLQGRFVESDLQALTPLLNEGTYTGGAVAGS